MIHVTWRRVIVTPQDPRNPGEQRIPRDFYEAWKPGFPQLHAYGETLDDAITALLNKHGE